MDLWNAPMVQSRQPLTYVDGEHGPGRPKMTWKQLTERDCREWKLSAIDPHDRHTWRSGVRSAIRLTDEGWQSSGPIRHSGGDDMSRQ